MTEQIRKYMVQNARVFCITLSDAVKRSAELNDLTADDTDRLGRLQVFTCCIAALQKVDKASVIARLSLPTIGQYSATADRDGSVRGLKEDSADGMEATLEVTLQLPLRGNYTGVVTGSCFEDLVTGYFFRSLQIASACKVLSCPEGYVCILVEKLPGEDCDLEQICNDACAALPFGSVPKDFVFLEESALRFGCTCSRAALLRIVSALPPEDRQDLSENGKIVTHCNSCGKKYTFEV